MLCMCVCVTLYKCMLCTCMYSVRCASLLVALCPITCNHGYCAAVNHCVAPWQEYNLCYVYLVEEKLAEALTSYRQMEEGEFTRLSDAR